MTPSLVRAGSTMPETDEVHVCRHQGSMQSMCYIHIANYVSVCFLASARRIPDKPDTMTERKPRMKAGYDANLTSELSCA